MEIAKKQRRSARIYEMVIFAMLGTLMFCSKIIMEVAPNIHLLGMFTIVFTLVYRVKALIPIYIYVVLNGAYSGFSMWWIPYTYIWTVLWAITMLLPKRMPKAAQHIVYPILCGLHGFAFGILYSPAQAVMFGLNFEQMLAWIAAGFYFDLIHGVGNIAAGLLIVPLTELLRKLSRMYMR
ncbi:MAG: hypothetical protein E7634_04500 [Ruminococcaceae bacterium]|nr:hypothetical protein [Oscillospiraceae bacterium]